MCSSVFSPPNEAIKVIIEVERNFSQERGKLAIRKIRIVLI